MAYEISEGAAAAAVLLSTTELNKLNGRTDKDYQYLGTAMKMIYDQLDNVNMSVAERTQYKAWFNPEQNLKENKAIDGKGRDARLTAVLHGYSAAKGIKAWFRSSQSGKGTDDKVAAKRVYVTGASWSGYVPDISFLKMTVGKWADYNSSDLVIIKGDCYYGVSLKKKKKESAADPPMINKSVKALLEELGEEGMAAEFYNARSRYFGGKVREQTLKGALAGSKITGMTNTDLFNTTIKNYLKSTPEWTNLMDLKGRGKLTLTRKGQYDWNTNKGSFITDLETNEPISVDTKEAYMNHPAVRELFGYDRKTGKLLSESKWMMRKNINSKLANINPLYQRIQKIVDKPKLATEVGKALVKAVMKTEMKKEYAEINKTYADKHFGFALVTAMGEIKSGKITGAPATASFKSDPTMQQTIANLYKAIDHRNFKITLDVAKTEKAKAKSEPPAKLFFVIGIGDVDLLQMEVRYKGSFSPSPQFLGGVTKTFTKMLNKTTVKEQYKFGEACNK